MEALRLLEELMYNGRVEVKPGVFLVQRGEINIQLYDFEREKVVIKFKSPQPVIVIERIGILKSLVKPVLNKIQITEDKVIIVLDRFKDMIIDRRELEEQLNKPKPSKGRRRGRR